MSSRPIVPAFPASDTDLESMDFEEVRREIHQIEIESLRVARGEVDFRRRFPEVAERLDALVAQLKHKKSDQPTTQLSPEESYDLREQLLEGLAPSTAADEEIADEIEVPTETDEDVDEPTRDYDLALDEDQFEVHSESEDAAPPESTLDAPAAASPSEEHPTMLERAENRWKKAEEALASIQSEITSLHQQSDDERDELDEQRQQLLRDLETAQAKQETMRRETTEKLGRLAERMETAAGEAKLSCHEGLDLDLDSPLEALRAGLEALGDEAGETSIVEGLSTVFDAIALYAEQSLGALAESAKAGEADRESVQEAQQQVEEQRKSGEALEAELDAARSQRTAALEQAAGVKERVDALETSDRELREAAEARDQKENALVLERDEATQARTTIEGEKNALEKDRDQARDELASARSGLDEAETRCNEIEEQRAAVQDRLGEAERQRDEKTGAAETLERALAEANERIEALDKKMGKAKAALEALTDDD